MSDSKKKPEKIVSPKGVFIFPWLNKPDTKFKQEGEYRVRLKVDADDAKPLIKKLEAMRVDAVKKAKADPKKKNKKVKEQDAPWSSELDDDGNETGSVIFNFKRLASGVKKDGSPWAAKPDLFDAKGKPMPASAQIYGGTIGKVAFTVNPYDTPIAGAGISLRLEGAQIIKLVEGSGRDASAYGFGDESDDDDAEASSDDEDSDDEDSDDEGADADEF